MSFLEGVRQHKDTLLRGLTLLIGGAALVLVGSLLGAGENRWLDFTGGMLAVTGVTIMFLGFFLYVMPPLLPAK